MKILPSSRIRIEGKFLDPKNQKINSEISFLGTYADVTGLGMRIENLELFDESRLKIEVKKLSAGEYQAAKNPVSFDYDVKIDALDNPAWAAHVSWLKENRGLLMLNDLLPQWKGKTSGRIIFEVPEGLKITGSEIKTGENIFAVKNIEKAIFLVGRNWREKTVKVDRTSLNLAIAGEWQFSDDEASEMAASILTEYRRLFAEIPVEQAQIFILPLNVSDPNRWRAETRGQTVTVISGVLPTKREALQRLHEQLRHEIFHLWIPNAVNLTGNYDWFYEGFTIYEALRSGVWLNQIRFEDYLNTLSRAFELSKNQNISLVEMSNRRWTGTNNSVYAKGMIIAFLCDLALLDQSKGKRSVTEVFQKLYRKYHAAGTETDGSAAVLNLLKTYPELQPAIKNYIEGHEKIELTESLKPFGLGMSENGGAVQLQVLTELSNRQKDLLDKLGYNRWRKLLQK